MTLDLAYDRVYSLWAQAQSIEEIQCANSYVNRMIYQYMNLKFRINLFITQHRFYLPTASSFQRMETKEQKNNVIKDLIIINGSLTFMFQGQVWYLNTLWLIDTYNHRPKSLSHLVAEYINMNKVVSLL